MHGGQLKAVIDQNLDGHPPAADSSLEGEHAVGTVELLVPPRIRREVRMELQLPGAIPRQGKAAGLV